MQSSSDTDNTARRMKGLWQSVLLKAGPVDAKDNFFDLGGTWTKATMLSMKAADKGLLFKPEMMVSADRASLLGGSSSTVLSAPTLRRMLEQLEHVVLQLTTCGPHDTLREVRYLSRADRQQSLERNRVLPSEVTACVHEQFMSVAQHSPEWDGSFSYAELDRFSSHLAGYQIPNMMIGDHIWDRLEPLWPTRSEVVSSPSDAAFVSFSSGSTGIPKASVVEHRSVCSLARYRGELISHGIGTRLFQYTSYTFDVAYCDMVTTLLHRGCLCIASDQDLMNNLAQSICRFGANLTYLTPSVLDMITPDSVPTLENLIVGGEPIWRSAPSLEAYYAQEVAEPMGSGSPLSRCALIDGRYFIWTCNHAIYDAWSVDLVMSQLEQAYQGLALRPEVPFVSFINHLYSTDMTAVDVFWRQALVNCQAQPLYQRSPAQVDTLLALEMALPMRSRFTDITTSTLIQTAWAVVLAHETNSNDVVLGLTVTGRDTPIAGIERMTGPVITTIPLRIIVNKDEPLDRFLQDIQAMAKTVIPYQHAGFSHIQNLSSHTSQACDAAIPIEVNVNNHHKEALGSAIGLERSQRTPLAESPSPLFIDCSASKNALDVYITFDSHILPRTQIRLMLARFRSIFWQLCVDAAGKTVGDLRMEDIKKDDPNSKVTLYETHSGMGFDARTGKTCSMV